MGNPVEPVASLNGTAGSSLQAEARDTACTVWLGQDTSKAPLSTLSVPSHPLRYAVFVPDTVLGYQLRGYRINGEILSMKQAANATDRSRLYWKILKILRADVRQ